MVKVLTFPLNGSGLIGYLLVPLKVNELLKFIWVLSSQGEKIPRHQNDALTEEDI
jgi:hypothetical protein